MAANMEAKKETNDQASLQPIKHTEATHFYFQCEDDAARLLLVDAPLFTTAGNLPSHSWFSYTFGGKTARPAPIRWHAKTNFPVYYLPVPYDIMHEMLRLMRFPPFIKDAYQHVPQALQRTTSLATWRAYLDYYGLAPITDAAAQRLDAKEVTEKTNAKLIEIEARPTFTYARRVAEALVALIKDGRHPKMTDFTNGATDTLKCEFINTFYESGVNYTYHLTVPGVPHIEPVNLAFYLGFTLKRQGGFNIMRDGKPSLDYFEMCCQRAFGEPVTVDINLRLSRDTRAKKTYDTKHWPAMIHSLTPRHYDVTELQMTRYHGTTWKSYKEHALSQLERTVKREMRNGDSSESAVSVSSDNDDDDKDGEE